MFWTEITSDEFEGAVKESKGVCAIPIGCVERHGTHLPLGNDTFLATYFCRKAAEIEPVTIFPEFYFGEKSGAGEFPGTIILHPNLIFSLLEACCFEIARNGFHKIVLVSHHGGNKAMLENFARAILHRKPNFQVFVYKAAATSTTKKLLENKEKYPYLTEEDWACISSYVEANKKGGHGCFAETAQAYDAFPHLCKLEKMNTLDGTSTKRFAEFDKRKIYTPFSWMANFPNSLTADAHEGLNERIARAFGQHETEALAEIFHFLKTETESEKYLKEWLSKQP